MILTAQNLVHYLLDRSLLTPATVVDGDLLIAEQSSRNRNFRVICHAGPSYFVKQVKTVEPEAIASLQIEALCYRLAQTDPDFAPLATLAPYCYGYDATRHVIALELLATAENLNEYHRRRAAFPPEMGTLVGQHLGLYHRELGRTLPNSPHRERFRRQIPWILQVHQLPWQLAPGQSGATAQVLGIVQRYPEFQARLDALRAGWQLDSLIHGDIKWENCVVTGQADPATPPGLKIVDWELADIGDAGWDVGAIFQAYLSFWIFALPLEQGVAFDQALDNASFPLEAMHPALQAFWSAYTTTRNLDARAARALLEKSVQYGAARMIQTAYEYMYFAPQISANTVSLLQVSLNVLDSPAEAITHLFGL